MNVEVWRVSLDGDSAAVSACLGLLSPDERARADQFRFPLHRSRFVVGRAAVREILARCTAQRPEELHFSYNAWDKPFLEGDPIHFNVSHSAALMLLAVSPCPIGIDIEHMDATRYEEQVARDHFSPTEMQELLALPAAERPRAFFRCWVRKEAYVKAKGQGLSIPLDSFDVTVGSWPSLRATRPDSQEASAWSIMDVPIDDGFLAALVVRIPERANPNQDEPDSIILRRRDASRPIQ